MRPIWPARQALGRAVGWLEISAKPAFNFDGCLAGAGLVGWGLRENGRSGGKWAERAGRTKRDTERAHKIKRARETPRRARITHLRAHFVELPLARRRRRRRRRFGRKFKIAPSCRRSSLGAHSNRPQVAHEFESNSNFDRTVILDRGQACAGTRLAEAFPLACREMRSAFRGLRAGSMMETLAKFRFGWKIPFTRARGRERERERERERQVCDRRDLGPTVPLQRIGCWECKVCERTKPSRLSDCRLVILSKSAYSANFKPIPVWRGLFTARKME